MSIKWRYQWFKDVVYMGLRLIKLHVMAQRKSKELWLVQDNLKRIKRGDLLLFSVMKNESHRLPFFLEYYRKLGVNHFILVDNESKDDFLEITSGQEDVTSFHAKGSYKDSNFGMHWTNYLLRKYGSRHWCLTCDPDEFIVYPEMESRSLHDLTDYLASIREESFFSCMIDMYGDKPITVCHYEQGTDPLDVCPYFDRFGYAKTYIDGLRNIWVQGGVRRRVFSIENPSGAPALNKIPLVKWQPYFAYVESMHMAIPRRLNECISKNKTTGALLHFKFISQLRQKVDEELEAKQHFNDSVEYKQYDSVINSHQTLFCPSVSERYENWRTLARLGLMNKGEW